MSEFRIEIKDKKAGSKVFGYILMSTRNGYQWSGIPVDDANQMRQIAKALLNKAYQIDLLEKGER